MLLASNAYARVSHSKTENKIFNYPNYSLFKYDTILNLPEPLNNQHNSRKYKTTTQPKERHIF